MDSSEAAEGWDLYATMFGGVPKVEVDALDRYWKVWPSLKGQLYSDGGGSCFAAVADDVAATVKANADVVSFLADYRDALAHLPAELRKRLVDGALQVDAVAEEEHIAAQLHDALSGIALVDGYDAYQALDDAWTGISSDLEVIQTEGREAVRKVDPNMVVKNDGVFVAASLKKAVKSIGKHPDGDFEEGLVRAQALLDEEKKLKKACKEALVALEEKTKEAIEGLTDDQCDELLAAKWIEPLQSDLLALPDAVVSDFIAKVVALNAKYATTYSDVCNQINEAEKELAAMLGQLTGNEYDMAGIAELWKLLGGE